MKKMIFPLSGEVLGKIKGKLTAKEIEQLKEHFFPLETIEEYLTSLS